MEPAEQYTNERLDHLGIVAGVCHEIGLAAWLDAQDPSNRQQVSVGTATVAMIINGLGFQQSPIVFGAAVLRQQTDRVPVGGRDQG